MKGECGNCRSKERLVMHRLSIGGMDGRVCTSCVLRLHPSFFCPFCFEFFDNCSSSSQRFISCTKCSSLSHLRCLPSPPPPPPQSPFLCPPCSQPGFSFFPHSDAPIDTRRALVLLCASKVAAASLAKSLSLANARVDKTVREAALARKRARDALDVCSLLDKVKRIDSVSNNRILGINYNYNNHNHNNNNVVTKKEDLNGFAEGQGQGQINKVKVVGSEVVSLPRPVNTNDAAKLGNRDRSVQGSRVLDVTST